MYRVDPLSHTADVGYEVTADSLPELFRGAADGLVRAVRSGPGDDSGGEGAESGGPGDPEARRDDGGGADGRGAPRSGREAETLTLEGPDRDRLMVAWLRELLYRITRDGRLPAGLDLEMTGPSALRARLRWSPAGSAETVRREVKGVTYHGLHVDEDDEGRWHARLVLDV